MALNDVDSSFRLPEIGLNGVDGNFWLPKIALEARQDIYLQPFRFKNRKMRVFWPLRMLSPACETHYPLV
jgi:hypothetical protein